MLKIGQINRLTVNEIFPTAYILKCKNSTESLPVMLKDSEQQLAIDEMIDVFVYTQANGELCASLQHPKAMLDEFAPMFVVGASAHGCFFNWGIEADLYAPEGQLHGQLDVGCKYIVKVVQDRLGKLVGTTRIERFLKEPGADCVKNKAVTLLVYAETPLGFKVVVDKQYSGLLYKNELITKTNVGDELNGYIKQIRDDGKLDISLQAQGKHARQSLSEAILEDLKAHDGMSTLTDKSSPQEIFATFKVSKNAYKKAIGTLYKQKQISIKENCLYLNNE